MFQIGDLENNVFPLTSGANRFYLLESDRLIRTDVAEVGDAIQVLGTTEVQALTLSTNISDLFGRFIFVYGTLYYYDNGLQSIVLTDY